MRFFLISRSTRRAHGVVKLFEHPELLHDEDMHEVGKPPRRSKAAVMASLKTALGSVKLSLSVRQL